MIQKCRVPPSPRGVHQTSSHCSTVCESAGTSACSAGQRESPGQTQTVLTSRSGVNHLTKFILPEESDIPDAPEVCDDSAGGAVGAEGAEIAPPPPPPPAAAENDEDEEDEAGGGW